MSAKSKNWLLYGLIALLVLGGGGAATAYYMWNKPHENVADQKAAYKINAAELFSAFSQDEAAATAKYLGKTIVVSGKVKEAVLSPTTGMVRVSFWTDDPFDVSCELDPLTKHKRTNFTAGETVSIKGICTGYAMDVQLTRCVEAD